jgi:hypothetical protein
MTWEKVIYKAVEVSDPACLELIEALKTLYINGGVILKCFEPENLDVFKRARFKQSLEHLPKTFLLSSSVMNILAEEIQLTEQDVLSLKYSWYSTFEFEGALIHSLLTGGAYDHFKGSEDKARDLARKFVEALIPKERLSARVFRIEGAWTAWYYDIAWDTTFMIYDEVGHKCWLLCITDTD